MPLDGGRAASKELARAVGRHAARADHDLADNALHIVDPRKMRSAPAASSAVATQPCSQTKRRTGGPQARRRAEAAVAAQRQLHARDDLRRTGRRWPGGSGRRASNSRRAEPGRALRRSPPRGVARRLRHGAGGQGDVICTKVVEPVRALVGRIRPGLEGEQAAGGQGTPPRLAPVDASRWNGSAMRGFRPTRRRPLVPRRNLTQTRAMSPGPLPASSPTDRPAGHGTDFSYLHLSPAGAVERPPVDIAPVDTSPLACSLVRVLDDEGRAVGRGRRRWRSGACRSGRRRSRSTCSASARRRSRSPTRWRCSRATCASRPTASRACCWCATTSMVEMMCQAMSNERDPIKGRQLPLMHSYKRAGFFTISATWRRSSSGGGWAMASAIKGDTKIASAGSATAPRRRATSHRADLRPCVPRAGDPERRQQPVGDLHLPGHRRRRGDDVCRARRGLRHRVAARRRQRLPRRATRVAAGPPSARRSNLGPTLIEWVTYRAGAHSTATIPSRYRPPTTGALPARRPDRALARHLDRRSAPGPTTSSARAAGGRRGEVPRR